MDSTNSKFLKACSTGDLEKAKALLKKGANVTLGDNEALFLACSNHQLEIVDWLLSHTEEGLENVDLSSRGYQGFLVLTDSEEFKDEKLFSKIMQHPSFVFDNQLFEVDDKVFQRVSEFCQMFFGYSLHRRFTPPRAPRKRRNERFYEDLYETEPSAKRTLKFAKY